MPGRVLYWWTNDLRVRDNQALQCTKSFDALLNVFIVDPQWFNSNRYQTTSMGQHRWQFLQQSLAALAEELEALGQRLIVLSGEPSRVLNNLASELSIDCVHTSRSPGIYEQSVLSRLAKGIPYLNVQIFDNATLFDQRHINSNFNSIPRTFSTFEKAGEAWQPEGMSAYPEYLPAPFSLPGPQYSDHLDFDSKFSVKVKSEWMAGEADALKHVDDYFASDLPKSYRDTRNQLSGWESSTKFSGYLTHGCLSPKQIYFAIQRYKKEHDLDKQQLKSVNWIYKEILWREYFQWLAYDLGSKLYSFQGLATAAPLTSFYTERFRKWCEGNTPYELVNACMLELRETGYISNRGRQIVASCLVNELEVDWRYGAAWFEQQLIDYDVASNWCNWQYLAGVGVDPRGGRHFNLEKQTMLYDADGKYRDRWLDRPVVESLDSVDMVDWPIPI